MATAFNFPTELGAQLCRLRRQAGLSLRDMAHVMNRKKTFNLHLSRLESGKLKHPTLSLIADYLRACRASFNDILVPLAEYTNLPPLREKPDRERARSGLAGAHGRDAQRLSIYDRKTADTRKAAGQKPVPPQKRAQALARQLRSAREQRQLSRLIEDEVNRLGTPPTLMVRKLALDYGRMVWRALEATEKWPSDQVVQWSGEGKAEDIGRKSKRGRPRKTRAERQADAEARAKALGPGILTNKAYRQLRAQVEKLFEVTYPPWTRQR